MKPERIYPPAIRTVVIEIDEDLAAAAESLGLELAAACRLGFAAEVRRKRREAVWLEENRAAIEGMNAWVEKNGLPLEQYRAW